MKPLRDKVQEPQRYFHLDLSPWASTAISVRTWSVAVGGRGEIKIESGVNCFLDKNKLYYLLYRQRYYWTICYLWLLFRLLLQFWIHKGRDFNSDKLKSGQRVDELIDYRTWRCFWRSGLFYPLFSTRLFVILYKEAKNSKSFQVEIHRILPMKIKMKIFQLDFYLLPKLLFSL